MVEHWHALRLIVTTAWRCDRRRTLAAATEPLGNMLALLSALWLAMLTTGVLHDDASRVVVGVVGLVAGAALGWQLDLSASQWRLVLSEKVSQAFEAEIARLCAALPDLAHQEHAEYRDKLELLRQRQGTFGRSLNALAVAVKAVCGGLTVFTMLVVVHPWMLGLAVLVLPAIGIARRQQEWRRASEEASAGPGRLARHLRSVAYDRDAGMEVRVFGLADEIAGRASRAWYAYRRPLQRAQRRVSLLNAVGETGYVLGAVAAIGVVMWRALDGQAPPGDVVLAVLLSQQVQSAVIWPITTVGGLGETLRTAGRFRWLQDYAATSAARRGSRPAPERFTDGIVFDNVSFRYPGSTSWVLRHVNLRVPAGSVLAVVGENGTGKTTLVKLLTRMYQPTEGRILVDGVDLAEMDVKSWRSRLAAAFQDFARFEFTAQHTVGLGDLPKVDDTDQVVEALDRAGAVDVLSALPEGTGTQLGARWNGIDLSTGQWQKLALGRALMRTEPLVLFFDEPTASLDAATEHALFERYAAAARRGSTYGAITILVSHRFSTVRSADEIVVLSGQRVTEKGTHAELMHADLLYADLYKMQARGYQHAR